MIITSEVISDIVMSSKFLITMYTRNDIIFNYVELLKFSKRDDYNKMHFVYIFIKGEEAEGVGEV